MPTTYIGFLNQTRPEVDAAEQEVIREYVASQEGPIHSSGGGGIGNVNRSRSRLAVIEGRLAVAELAIIISYQAAPVSRNPWMRRSAGNTSTTLLDYTDTPPVVPVAMLQTALHSQACWSSSSPSRGRVRVE
ncbi:hypothetical protein BDZ97DRAFT_2074068 [Flammula alnicola]|nr:hypothetical protein BDZ97DRAFT_2074068 [Flammula alnicola]